MYDVAIWYDRQTGTNNRGKQRAVGGWIYLGRIMCMYVCQPQDVQTLGKYHPVRLVAHGGPCNEDKHSHWCGWKHKDGKLPQLVRVDRWANCIRGTRCTNIRTKKNQQAGCNGIWGFGLGARSKFWYWIWWIALDRLWGYFGKIGSSLCWYATTTITPCQWDSICTNGQWVYTAKTQPYQGTEASKDLCCRPYWRRCNWSCMHYTQNASPAFSVQYTIHRQLVCMKWVIVVTVAMNPTG